MHEIEVSLPDELMEYVNQQVRSGGYNDISQYLHDLITFDERDQAEARLEALILDGVTSGEPREMTDDDWNNIHRKIREREEARKSAYCVVGPFIRDTSS
jgi:antitoxin ParD1/3/4